MPVGDRALALLDDSEDVAKLRRFLDLVPRFLRNEVRDVAPPFPAIKAKYPFRPNR